jgi:DNA mismatch repair protein MutL
LIQKKIKKIQDAEKIAAGEVVDRPANIVKELIENSIDAGAKEIKVIIQKAGKHLIHIFDDGKGIPPDEVEIAFERHTSSKINVIDDLDTLETLGFRGEALASIAAVSKVEITTRTVDNDLGVRLLIADSKIISNNSISCSVGTEIKVKNLFFNLPARQKFLKKDATELAHITDIIQRYALAYPEIHFIYKHNNINILNCPAFNDLKTTVFHIYGKKIANFMEPIKSKEKSLNVFGLLGHSEISRNTRNISSLFINKRYIISDLFFRAIKDAYKGVLMIGKFPFFILFIDIDPSLIDFNVHPKKLEVRFENEEFMYNKIYTVIRKRVEELFIEKEDTYTFSDLTKYIEQSTTSPIKTNQKPSKLISKPTPTTTIPTLKEKSAKKSETNSVQLKVSENSIGDKTKIKNFSESYLREKYIVKKNFPKLRLISQTGQLSNKVYVVLEGLNENDEPGIYFLDQHAASERVNKEFFIELYEKLKTSKQRLISPLKIEVSPSEKHFLQANLKEIRKLGFGFEHFGGNTFILREIPTIMGRVPNTDIIKEIINDITEIGKDRSFQEIKDQIINYLACHKSIRGGDDLTIKDIRKLILDLANCKDSYHCAHGRPTLRFLSFKDLDKLFKRIV